MCLRLHVQLVLLVDMCQVVALKKRRWRTQSGAVRHVVLLNLLLLHKLLVLLL